MHFQLSWRNIWRNPRRTAIILIAVSIGVWSMVVLGALWQGMVNQMITNGIATMTGHLQIHQKDYRNDPVVENSISDPDRVAKVIDADLPDKAVWSSRIRVTAVAANARHSVGVTVIGIDPDREAKVSFIEGAIRQGRYLKTDDPYGILIGQALADKFATKLGRKVVLMSQDTEKEIGSRAFRIAGIFRAEMEATEKQFVFITKPAARKLLKLGTGVSEYAIVLPEADPPDLESIVARLQANLSEDVRVEGWPEILPMVKTYVEMIQSWNWIWYLVVFIAMGFGIVNTMLMAVYERMREFGVLKALGMKPGWIVKDVLAESFFLLLGGMLIGNGVAFLTVWVFSRTGIDLSALSAGAEYAGIAKIIYPALNLQDVAIANLMVFLLGMVISLYPAIRAARFTPVEAMAHV
ncbi:MAG: ABC transporter permease [Desulfobacterales bacterium]|nr:ABC transporter permease [Desulfobacterales bacterium]